MKKFFALILAVAVTMPLGVVSANDDIKIKYNGTEIVFNEESIVLNERTLVQLRPIAEALDLGIEYALESGTVILSDSNTVVEFRQNSNFVTINGNISMMDVPMIVHNNYSFVPVRTLVEPFGNDIVYDPGSKTITITPKVNNTYVGYNDTPIKEPVKPEPKEISTGSGKYNFPFFYQSQPDVGFENNGRGYCWVCSYAMLFSGASDKVITPLDIANFNIEKGYSGNYMAGHESLARSFGFKLVPALSESSQYYGGFNLKNRGDTTLKVETDDDVRAALREILDNFPGGVIVRYEGYPHSMMAVDYDDNYIYFNDPGFKEGEYVTFDKTCLKNFKLSDISFVQAVK